MMETAQDWPTGLAELVEPGVRRVLAGNPSAFTYTGTQTYLVGQGNDLAVIDPGPDDAAHFEALLAAIGEAKVSAICCTHTHRDHSPLAARLSLRLDAPVIGCAPVLLEDDGPRADAPFDLSYAPDRVLADGERLEGEGWSLNALATPGHTSNHLCYSLEGTGVLFTGDHVMGWSTSIVAPPDGNMADYMASLTKLHDREDRIYLAAHGAPILKPRQLVRGMIGHRRQRERQILRHLEAGQRRIADMVPLMYKGVAEQLWPAAGRSVLAHLIDLETRGLVTRDGDGWFLA